MDNLEFKALLRKYNTGNCTDEEKALIESWYMKFEHADQGELTGEQIDGILAMQVPVQFEPKRKPLWKWVSVAAAILVVTAAGTYLALNRPADQQQIAVEAANDIAPGTNKAVLTLATGQKIILNNAQTGILTTQADVTIRKAEDGKVVYSAGTDREVPSAVLVNTMSTPRGGQYHLTLTDGTRVWLNAASSITYPTRFAGKERKVETTGEVYFEVAHLSNQPFHVVSKGQDVEVLGTHFNINAYADEPVVKTTLLEGSVKVSNLNTHISNLLKPGEQSILSSSGLAVVAADVEQAMAWREGKFRFGENSDIHTVMTEIARWYDIDVEYRGKITRHFGGSISRQVAISKVLTLLQTTGGVNFKVEGRRVIVMP